MRYLALAALLVGCSEALPKAGTTLNIAKSSLSKADDGYTRACVPPADDKLAKPCYDLAGALDAADVALSLAIDAYNALNDAAKDAVK